MIESIFFFIFNPKNHHKLALDEPARTASDTETALARVWMRLLDVDRIQLDDDFFSLGGHSILATRAVLEANREFGLKLPMTALLANPTVAGMAAAIDRLLEVGGDTEAAAELEHAAAVAAGGR